MAQLVDTHCHIQSVGLTHGERSTSELWSKEPDFSVDEVIRNSLNAGVTKMICIGCDLADSQLAVDFVQGQENCWASIGIHPHGSEAYVGQKDLLDQFAALATSGT